MRAIVRAAVTLLIVIATASALGRLMSTQMVYEPSQRADPTADPEVDRRSKWPDKRPRPMPTYSSNDRARWATVRALVDHDTYVVGRRETIAEKPGYKDSGIIFEDGWQTIDRVLHPQSREFYSSKPPLLSTLVAGLYWLLKHLFGWTLDDDPFAVVRTILVVVNIFPFAIYLWLLDRWVARFAKSEWTRLLVIAAAAFGTTVTPFLITFNNHTLGTFGVLFALDALFAIWFGVSPRQPGCSAAAGLLEPSWLRFVQAGFFAAFAASNELPALAFVAAVFGLLGLCDVKRTLLFALPPALIVAAGFFGTNYLAVGQWRPAYSEFGSEWYEYEGSHWRKPADGEMKYGIDWARMHESRGVYAFHVLLGHHGLFSLTPLWLLAMIGAAAACRPARVDPAETRPPDVLEIPWFLGPLTLGLTAVVVGFYLYKSDNYGGFTNGLRWLMWLTPLWLFALIPAVDWMASCPRRRAFVYVLLAVSILSAHYSPWNPWRHPWIYDLISACGWPGYGR